MKIVFAPEPRRARPVSIKTLAPKWGAGRNGAAGPMMYSPKHGYLMKRWKKAQAPVVSSDFTSCTPSNSHQTTG